jgi:hypothetical protein
MPFVPNNPNVPISNVPISNVPISNVPISNVPIPPISNSTVPISNATTSDPISVIADSLAAELSNPDGLLASLGPVSAAVNARAQEIDMRYRVLRLLHDLRGLISRDPTGQMSAAMRGVLEAVGLNLSRTEAIEDALEALAGEQGGETRRVTARENVNTPMGEPLGIERINPLQLDPFLLGEPLPESARAEDDSTPHRIEPVIVLFTKEGFTRRSAVCAWNRYLFAGVAYEYRRNELMLVDLNRYWASTGVSVPSVDGLEPITPSSRRTAQAVNDNTCNIDFITRIPARKIHIIRGPTFQSGGDTVTFEEQGRSSMGQLLWRRLDGSRLNRQLHTIRAAQRRRRNPHDQDTITMSQMMEQIRGILVESPFSAHNGISLVLAETLRNAQTDLRNYFRSYTSALAGRGTGFPPSRARFPAPEQSGVIPCVNPDPQQEEGHQTVNPGEEE